MQTIEKTIEIDAPIEKVYEVLVNPQFTRAWGNAFSEGAHVESDWKPGSEVVWKDKDGNVGAKGIVIENEPSRRIAVAFYDDVNAKPPTAPGQYKEVYMVQPNQNQSQLKVEAGALPESDIKSHSPLWDKALQVIKELAEK
jgi:uncharacterized protein YndB with AHSA1/START domain